MRVYFLVLISILQTFQLLAQVNLVQNGSFEEYFECPNDFSQIHLAKFWYWINNTQSPDFYHKCAPANSGASVPIHRVQKYYKIPNGGDGFAGIITYHNAGGFGGNPRPTEYLLSPMKYNLKQGKQYYLRFFVSPRISLNSDRLPCFTDAIGMVLSKDSIAPELGTNEYINLPPAIENRGKLIDNPDAWLEISGCTIGQGEKYIC